MRTIVGLWRWRRNPLRRGTDLVEAWVALAAALLLALGTPAAGWAAGTLIDSSLQRTVHLQHEQRRLTTAVVTGTPGAQQLTAFDTESAMVRGAGSEVVATWHAADGSPHTGTVVAPARDMLPGSSFRVWADQRGTLVRGPMNGTNARVHAVLAGFGSAALAAGLLEGARRLIVWRLVQQRYHRLDRAWAKAGPDWGRADAGS